LQSIGSSGKPFDRATARVSSLVPLQGPVANERSPVPARRLPELPALACLVAAVVLASRSRGENRLVLPMSARDLLKSATIRSA